MTLERRLGFITSMFVVMASMIGSFIFAVPGAIFGAMENGLATLGLWVAGGIVAFAGSLVFAEYSTMMPHVGGEYIYLRNTYGLLPAFLSGWISLFVAFSASIASSAIVFHEYLAKFIVSMIGNEQFQASILSNRWVLSALSSGIVILLGMTHIIGLNFGSKVQNVLTTIKLSVVVIFIICGLTVADWSQASRLVESHQGAGSKLTFTSFGSTLLLVMIAYSGWNAATYISGEVKNPEKNLPRALFWGTLSVTVIYFLLNVVFLISSPASQISGNWTVGAVAAGNLFGDISSKIFNVGIMLILLSSISVQMMIGPRVYYAMSQDRVIFKSLSKVSDKFKTPHVAILTQILITVIYIYLGKDILDIFFDYIGFALSLTPFITVLGLMYLRKRHPEMERPYKVRFYPWVPLVYLVASGYMMISALIEKPGPSFAAIGLLLAGVICFYIWKQFWARAGMKLITNPAVHRELAAAATKR